MHDLNVVATDITTDQVDAKGGNITMLPHDGLMLSSSTDDVLTQPERNFAVVPKGSITLNGNLSAMDGTITLGSTRPFSAAIWRRRRHCCRRPAARHQADRPDGGSVECRHHRRQADVQQGGKVPPSWTSPPSTSSWASARS